ncbi:unnamed protein product [Rotaria sp. Silwood1]|nr:unnamed protein product [Rotaria sp. Silwood1]CAF1643514.1 unnamed protein product [Rotaria sp. Silwood1]
MCQYENPKCVTFTCLHDDTAQSIYTILCLNIPHHDSIVEFLGGKEEQDLHHLHQTLIRYKTEIYIRIAILPSTYRIHLQNLLNRLVSVDQENYKINHRESYIFTSPTDIENDDTNLYLLSNISQKQSLTTNEEALFKNINDNAPISSQPLNELRNTANHQQKYLVDFIQLYLDHLLKHSRRPIRVAKPKPFHIVVNGLDGSDKSYKINKRLNEIFHTSDKSDTYFGGIPVIAFGDMAQIEPIAAKQIFYRPPDELFSLWHDLFRPINFDINMRPGDD